MLTLAESVLTVSFLGERSFRNIPWILTGGNLIKGCNFWLQLKSLVDNLSYAG